MCCEGDQLIKKKDSNCQPESGVNRTMEDKNILANPNDGEKTKSLLVDWSKSRAPHIQIGEILSGSSSQQCVRIPEESFSYDNDRLTSSFACSGEENDGSDLLEASFALDELMNENNEESPSPSPPATSVVRQVPKVPLKAKTFDERFSASCSERFDQSMVQSMRASRTEDPKRSSFLMPRNRERFLRRCKTFDDRHSPDNDGSFCALDLLETQQTAKSEPTRLEKRRNTLLLHSSLNICMSDLPTDNSRKNPKSPRTVRSNHATLGGKLAVADHIPRPRRSTAVAISVGRPSKDNLRSESTHSYFNRSNLVGHRTRFSNSACGTNTVPSLHESSSFITGSRIRRISNTSKN